MTKEEKIIAEINLQITNLTIAQEEGFITEFGRGALEYLDCLRSFIRELPNDEEEMTDNELEEEMTDNELEEETTDNELEEEIQRHVDNCLDVKFPTMDIETIKKDVEYTSRHFAEWQKRHMMKDAVEGTYDCDDDTSWVSFDGWVKSSSEVGKKVKVIILREE